MMLSFVRRGVFGLLFAAAPHMMFAQATTGTVRGRVTDAGTGQGIANASVIVDGTRIGASTADNGTFSLSAVPTGTRVITVRRIGYQLARKPVTVNAGDNAVGDIALNVSAVNLSEVVVTGTAAPTEKRKLGTSIASVDSVVIGRALALTVDQALQGKVPGAQITQNSGARAAEVSPCGCEARTRLSPDLIRSTSSTA